MSTLSRYRKQGGFRQLLTLVETSVPAKRQQLLKVIGQESKTWELELNKRMLTAEKFFTFPAEAVERVLQTIPEQTWPKALFHLAEADRAKLFQSIMQFQPVHKQKQMQDYMASLKPTAGEIDAAQALIVKKAREMQVAGDLKLDKFDPMLALDGLDRMMI